MKSIHSRIITTGKAGVGTVFAVVVLGIMASPLVETAEGAPMPDVCDQTESGERLRCHFGNIVAQQQETANMIDTMPNVPDIQKQAIKNQVARTDRARGRASNNDFKQLIRKTDLQCQIAELDAASGGNGDGDGVCTGGEMCAEVLGDGIGNDDGVCQPRNGKKREMCVQLCDSEGINDNPDNFDQGLGADVEEQLMDLTDQYMRVNDALTDEALVQSAVQALAAAGNDCAAVISARTNVNTFAFLTGVAGGSRMAADIAERFCDQTVFGANGAGACSVIEGIAGLAAITVDTFAFIEGDVDSQTVDATLRCVQSLNTQAGQTTDALDAVSNSLINLNIRLDTVNNRLDAVDQKLISVEGQVQTVDDLLRTPQGNRDGFAD